MDKAVTATVASKVLRICHSRVAAALRRLVSRHGDATPFDESGSGFAVPVRIAKQRFTRAIGSIARSVKLRKCLAVCDC
jgi:hypothetical protein